jgi:hypothetical protein
MVLANRRGMEIAINTLVVLILGLVIMGGGIALVYNIYNKASALPGEVDQITKDQLFDILLGSKQKIAVLNNVLPAERRGSVTFAVAFQNQADAVDETYKVNVPQAPIVSPVSCGSPFDNTKCPYAFAGEGPYILKRYESKAFKVIVNVPASVEAGEYIFEINVTNYSNSFLYARTKVHVVVQ